MSTVLIKNATLVATMGDLDERIADGGVFVVDRQIHQVGPTSTLPPNADTVIDARDCVVMPGLVNTHHHFSQALTRAVPGAQDASLFGWLKTLYPIWANITPKAVYTSAKVAIAQLMLSGCTTSSDHTYLWPNGSRLDDEIQAALDMRFRFHGVRGSMSVGESKGGLPPDSVVEAEAHILSDSRRVIEEYHKAERFGMIRVALGPCSPFTVSTDLMRESVALARAYGVHSHTHLAETVDEEQYCLEHYGRRPAELIEDLDWMGTDVWHAHAVHLSNDEARRLGATRTGAAHCPTSNMRLASGIAPVDVMRASGVRLGLGVDGSASNDSCHLLAEVRQAMLLRRVATVNAGALSAVEALRLATRGGADALGRDDIGYLAPGMAADIVGFRIDGLAFAGAAVHDPLASIVFCQPSNAQFSVINGQVRVQNGEILGLDLDGLVANHNMHARGLVTGKIY